MSALPRPVLVAIALEVMLFVGTWLFLVRPQFLFGKRADAVGAWGSFFRGVGFVSACLLFCWSVVLGVLLLLNGMMVRV